MERVFFRAVLALSVLGIVVGAPSIYVGSKGVETWPKTLEAMTKDTQSRFDACMAHATAPEEIAACRDSQHDELMSALNVEVSGYNGAANLQTFGLLSAIALPVGLFALFYVLRWIATGSWKRKTT